ncbi:MAG: hypothetical protein QM793_03040 [Muricomes sp.]
MKDIEIIQEYPLKVNSTIIAPLAQHFYFSGKGDMPLPTLNNMYFLADILDIPKSSVRVALSRMCKDGSVLSVKDESGKTKYKMGKMMTLISEQASGFGKSEGFTLSVFNFKKEEEKQRYRVREILNSFGFKKLAQNVYLALKVDSQSIMSEFTAWGLQDNVFLFDCVDTASDSISSKIISLWNLDEWSGKLNSFYEKLKAYLNFEGLDDEEVYKRYSIAYSIFFTYFYEKHPAIPFNYLPKGYPLKGIFELLEKTIQIYGESIVRFYYHLNRK